jgi:hypothetical protein
MRGLIAARTAVLTAVAAIDADMRRMGAVKVTAARLGVARNDLSQAAIYAASARHSVNAAERLCL